jgi:hypothetical protein
MSLLVVDSYLRCKVTKKKREERNKLVCFFTEFHSTKKSQPLSEKSQPLFEKTHVTCLKNSREIF